MKRILIITFCVLGSIVSTFGQSTKPILGQKIKAKAMMAPRFYVTNVSLDCGTNNTGYKKCTNPNLITLESGAGTSVFTNEGLIVKDDLGLVVSNIKGINQSPFISPCLNLTAGKTYTIEVVNSIGGVYSNPDNGTPYIFTKTIKNCGINVKVLDIAPNTTIKSQNFSMACEPPCPSGKNCVDGNCQ